jgi:hypothetical protein
VSARAGAVLAAIALVFGCGGTDASIDRDATADEAGGDGGASGDSSTDGATSTDANEDARGPDAGFEGGVCKAPSGSCGNGCPAGSVCVFENGIILRELGCAPIPAGCDGSCACMEACVCTSTPCRSISKGISCGGG